MTDQMFTGDIIGDNDTPQTEPGTRATYTVTEDGDTTEQTLRRCLCQ